MRSPFPGMDPYLEHPALWPDVHNRLIAALADDLTPRVAPRYYVALDRTTHRFEIPVDEEVRENCLELRDVTSGLAITVVELLSPANKLHARGRIEYEGKRREVLSSRTHLVEVDLLRAGERMPVTGPPISGDYRILVSRSGRRPRAEMLGFSLRQPIPTFVLPLLPGDREPEVDLGAVLHGLYGRARFDLRLDYAKPAEPPLPRPDRDWAKRRIEAWRKS